MKMVSSKSSKSKTMTSVLFIFVSVTKRLMKFKAKVF